MNNDNKMNDDKLKALIYDFQINKRYHKKDPATIENAELQINLSDQLTGLISDNDSTKLYSVQDVAKILNLARMSVYRYIWAGDLKATKIGNFNYITKQDLFNFLIENKNGK